MLTLKCTTVFFFAPRGSVGSPVSHRKGKGENELTIPVVHPQELTSNIFTGWRGGFLLSAAEQYLKLELTKNFKVGCSSRRSNLFYSLFRCSSHQVIRDLELMPQLLGSDWSSVFLQRFAGSVTILPKSRILVGCDVYNLSQHEANGDVDIPRTGSAY